MALLGHFFCRFFSNPQVKKQDNISRKDETENLINILIYVDIIHMKQEKEGKDVRKFNKIHGTGNFTIT
jgi:hypothetical protein